MPSNSFWERKRQQLDPPNDMKPAYGAQPWWMSDPYRARTSAEIPGQQELDYDGFIDGHDVSKAGILKGDAEECPRCPRDPRTGISGNMYRPSKTAAIRCFDCGYVEGRDLGEGQFRAAVAEGPAHKARQVASGGAIVHNYRGGQVVDRVT